VKAYWRTYPEAIAAKDQSQFTSFDTLLACPMEQVTRDSVSGVSRLCLAATYYVKVFAGRKSRLRQLLGISRYQRELNNLAYFRSLGLRTPDLVACGHRTRGGLLHDAVLVTREVGAATDLLELVRSDRFYARGRQAARLILAQLAEATRKLHADGFYHQDLKPRNVLLSAVDEEPQLYFFDCPRGHRPARFRFQRCMAKELAHIERDLRGRVHRSDLMYAYRLYRGCDRLSSADKRLAREALTYYAERRMTAERRSRLQAQ
jgi:hypothetical protein